VEFSPARTPAAHHLALVGNYRQWPWGAELDRSPEALVAAQPTVAPAFGPDYCQLPLAVWRAGPWYDTVRSLSLLTTNSRTSLATKLSSQTSPVIYSRPIAPGPSGCRQ